MSRRSAAPFLEMLSGRDPDRLLRQKAWADRAEYDWLVIR